MSKRRVFLGVEPLKHPLELLTLKMNLTTMKMTKETWRTILQILASIISAALTALGTTSCMGYGPL